MIDPFHLRPSLSRSIKILALAALSVSACAAEKSASKMEKKDAAAANGGPPVSTYAQLAVGNAWTYEVKAFGNPATTSDTVRIVGRDGGWFLDDHRGRMRIDSLGLRDADRYLLRSPIELGKSWTSVEQMAVQRFEIAAVDAVVQTRAGLFENCVVVRNTEPLSKGSFITEWTYAPGTGLISLRTKTLSAAGKEQEQLRLSLSKFERAP